ncbi:MAG: ATP-binding cassette domain-containing protein [Clostridia bacterium]|nr:ATP-binding cassette domain-containing protein [Clostridia bacterium]
MSVVLKTDNLYKRYKYQFALNGVNMTINKGDIYGFVGENGSGKTTVIRLITGLISPTSGHFELFGEDSRSKGILNARKKIGAIVETPSIYLNMPAKDNLKMQCGLLGVKDNVEEMSKRVLGEVGLSDLYDNKKNAGNFSLGMRQRLGIAMALLGEPEFLILDEPMNGLDPAGIVEIRELILKLNKERGITFLISSHILTELSLVATTYGIISKGKIIKEISAEELKNVKGTYVLLKAEDRDALIDLISRTEFVKDAQVLDDCVKIVTDKVTPLLKTVLNGGVVLKEVKTHTFDIEEYYMSLVGGANCE